MPDTDAEIVLYTDGTQVEPDLLVDDTLKAAERFVAAGGAIVAPPFEIAVGRCAVVRDPFGNVLVMLDLSRGRFQTDERGNVTGVA